MDTLYGHPKWYFDSIFGAKYVSENCNKTKEDFLNNAPQFYTLYFTPKMVCLSAGYSLISTRITKEKDISNLRAYEIFGIERMEEAIEKTISGITKFEYRKKVIDGL